MLAKRLKQLRKKYKLTQKQIAAFVHIAERSYQRLEANEKPSYDVLIALADYFDVSLDYLVGRSDDPKRH